jgi:hypothetical protein
MGVQAHRVMMSWLMHELMPTASLRPTRFADFRERYAAARVFDSQNIVRGYTPHRFATFSWAKGIRSYTGYFALNSPTANNIIVPYKAYNTGNLLGWYTVEGRRTNAVPVVSGNYQLDGAGWAMNGELLTNDSTLDHRFAIYATPGNAILYVDQVRALADVTLKREQGALLAISTDSLTRPVRTLYYEAPVGGGVASTTLDGSGLTTLHSAWTNIDNVLGVVGTQGKAMAFGDRANNNSVMTAKLYGCYADSSRSVHRGDLVDARHVAYYSHVSADSTRWLSQQLMSLGAQLPQGWNGMLAADPDGTYHLLVARFAGSAQATISNIVTPLGAPVFATPTAITRKGATTTFDLGENTAVAQPVRYFVSADNITARTEGATLILSSPRRSKVTVASPGCRPLRLILKPNSRVTVSLSNGRLVAGETTGE